MEIVITEQDVILFAVGAIFAFIVLMAFFHVSLLRRTALFIVAVAIIHAIHTHGVAGAVDGIRNFVETRDVPLAFLIGASISIKVAIMIKLLSGKVTL